MAPRKTSRRPCPPESTTPASFKTGSISGVLASVSSACWNIPSKNVSRSDAESASSSALSAAALATVRMVPSFGFITALYAVSTPRSIAAAIAGASRSVSLRTPRVNPRRSCERITPELPRAPRREPEEIALARVSISGSARAPTSEAADMMVSVMFVPVSPSGTGNTFSSLIHSFFASRFLAPARNILESILASMVLLFTTSSSSKTNLLHVRPQP